MPERGAPPASAVAPAAGHEEIVGCELGTALAEDASASTPLDPRLQPDQNEAKTTLVRRLRPPKPTDEYDAARTTHTSLALLLVLVARSFTQAELFHLELK